MATAMRGRSHAAFSSSRGHAAARLQPRAQTRLLSRAVSCAQRMVPTTYQSEQPSMAPSGQQTHGGPAHHDLGSSGHGHSPALSRHTVLMHTSSASGPQPTQSCQSASLLAGVSVLEQFGLLGGVSDVPKLVSALTLVSCSTLRPPATALLGLALLEEATQLPYDLISLE